MGERLPYKQRVTGSSPVTSIESLAQLVERMTVNHDVVSSSLTTGVNHFGELSERPKEHDWKSCKWV